MAVGDFEAVHGKLSGPYGDGAVGEVVAAARAADFGKDFGLLFSLKVDVFERTHDVATAGDATGEIVEDVADVAP